MHTRTIIAIAGISLLGCEDSRVPTADMPAARSPAPGAAHQEGPQVNAFLPIPLDDTANTSGTAAAYRLTQIGTAPLLQLRGANATNPQSLFQITSQGTGNAAFISQQGTGTGVFIQMANSNSTASTLSLSHSGRGTLVSGGVGANVTGINLLGTSSANRQLLALTNFGVGLTATITGSNSTSGGLFVSTNGQRSFEAVNSSSSSTTETMRIRKGGPGFAAEFSNTNSAGNGVRITTVAGTAGLQVVGGSKNAVVGTSSGARALHAEEAAEVWFTDYGFGAAERGRVHIEVDPTFAETVRLDLPYHVFVQAYGPAELYVARRTTTGFDVVVKSGAQDAEFSWRLVATRRGFEGRRLDRAPWADQDPNLR